MYKITYGEKLVYIPTLAAKGYYVDSPSAQLALNAAGSASFVIADDHPLYSSITPLKGEVKIYSDDQRVFRGRVLSAEKDYYRRKYIYCEGALAYLNDAVVRPYEYTGSVSDYFAFLVNSYNSQVEEAKRFRVGVCTVTDPNDYIVRANQNYPTVLDEMEDKLLELLGGYFIPRYEIENGAEVEYLDYLADLEPGQQKLKFAENLLDIGEYISSENVYTRIIPLGAMDEETQERLTIESVNDGRDYLDSVAGIEKYGEITRVVVWDDVTLPEDLKTKAQNAVDAAIYTEITITVEALDLHLINYPTEALMIGKKYAVVSPPHGFDGTQYFPLSSIDLNMTRPDASKYTLGEKNKLLTKS